MGIDDRHLERRPEARAFSVEQLLQLIEDGRVRLPDFQRPLRWRSSHVLELFDSVYRGFPIGEFLFSKRPAKAERVSLGALSIEAPDVADALYVVDGQQRIVALAAAMLHPQAKPRGDIHSIWFDLEKEAFKRLTTAEPDPLWIPVNVAGDSVALHGWLDAWPARGERPDLVKRAFALGKALREYQVPAYVIESTSEEVLRLVFKRVNTTGVTMTESEVFDALSGQRRPVASACARLAETGFGEMHEDWFLRCLKAVEGLEPRRSFKGGEREVSASAEAVSRTEAALRLAITFLTIDAGIPHALLLPYRLPLLVLARFFHLFPSPAPRTRILLVRWLWREALSGRHTDSSHAHVAELQVGIRSNEHASIQHLLGRTERSPTFPPASTEWNGRSARARMCAVALYHLGAWDPETKNPMDVATLQLILSGRDLGKAYVDLLDVKKANRGGAGNTRATVAHRVLLAERGKTDALLNAGPDVWSSHGLDPEAMAALCTGDREGFLARRGELLDRYFAKFFRERCASDESDRLAIAELVRRVDAVAGHP